MSKGMTECKICHREFALCIEDHYVAQDPKKTGIIAVIGSNDPEVHYDAIDCPHCGCQNILQERKCPCYYGICDECEDEENEEDTEDGE